MRKSINIIGIITLLLFLGCENYNQNSKSMNLGEIWMDEKEQQNVEQNNKIQRNLLKPERLSLNLKI